MIPDASPGMDCSGGGDGTATDLARTSAPGTGDLSDRAAQRIARERRSAFPLHQSEDRSSRAHGDAGCGDRQGGAAARTGGGYEFEKDRYVLLDDEDFAQAQDRDVVDDDRRTSSSRAMRSTRSSSTPATTSCRTVTRDRTSTWCCAMRSRNRAWRRLVARGDVAARACRGDHADGERHGVHTLHEPRDLYAYEQAVRSGPRCAARCRRW